MKTELVHKRQWFCLLVILSGVSLVICWRTSWSDAWRVPMTGSVTFNDVDIEVKNFVTKHLNMSTLINKVRNQTECLQVAADPRSYWRSQSVNNSLNTSAIDFNRMSIAWACGILYEDYLLKPPTGKLYPFEKFYLSESPLTDVLDAASEIHSRCTPYNSRVGEVAAFKIEMKDGRGRPKLKGADQIRVWFEDYEQNRQMAAKVVDYYNGTYMASARLLWAGNIRLRVALAYPREYLRAVLYLLQTIKAFRPYAGLFRNDLASEATPCYHTTVVPGFDSSELCNLTEVNGSPWFCGRPIKSQLSCKHFLGTLMFDRNKNLPVTDGELKLLQSSPGPANFPVSYRMNVLPGKLKAKSTLPCHKMPARETWVRDNWTGFLSAKTWFPSSCHITKVDYQKCLRNKQILIFGDSNGRSHYYDIRRFSACSDIKKAFSKKWHRPLLCVDKKNNFSVGWEPHANPFMTGVNALGEFGHLIPTAQAINKIPAQGKYLIILTHYLHFAPNHISALDFMLRSIKEALVQLFQRNPNVQVVLQGPHIHWKGLPDYYATGDMFGENFMDMEHEIFEEIKDKVVFISPWDMTIAAATNNIHPAINKNILDVILCFMCDR